MKKKARGTGATKQIAFRITRKVNKNGSVQWEVYCGRENGKRIRKYFATELEAETFREVARTKKANHGIAALAMPESIRLEALTCSQRLAVASATLTQATEFFLLHHKPASEERLFQDVAAELLHRKIMAKKKKSYTDGLGWTFGVFNRVFGDRKISEIMPDEVEHWVWEMDYAPATVRGYLRDRRPGISLRSEAQVLHREPLRTDRQARG